MLMANSHYLPAFGGRVLAKEKGKYRGSTVPFPLENYFNCLLLGLRVVVHKSEAGCQRLVAARAGLVDI